MATSDDITPYKIVYCVRIDVEFSPGRFAQNIPLSPNYDDIEPAKEALRYIRKKYPEAELIVTEYRRAA